MKDPHILLIEDNEGDVLLTREALEECNANNKISHVKDGKEALDFLNREGIYAHIELPNIIYLDVNLPKKNGHEVLKYIKTDPKLRFIPVIMFTTSSSHHDITKAYDNFANCFITKPIDLEEFIFTIKEIQKFWFEIAKLPKING